MRRGFTFIEVAIVVPLVMVLSLVMFQLYMVFIAELQAAALQGDLKLDLKRAAAQIYRRARASGYEIDADNRGLRLGDGSRVRWQGDRLLLGSRSLLDQPVTLFLATQDQGELILTLQVLAPNRWRGEPRQQRIVFEGGPR